MSMYMRLLYCLAVLVALQTDATFTHKILGKLLEDKDEVVDRVKRYTNNFVDYVFVDHGQKHKQDEPYEVVEIGVAGPPGKQGVEGKRGYPGRAGTPGLKGDRGDPGKIGRTGLRGFNGSQGTKGEIGNPGENGKTGERGLAGPTGLRGLDGAPGNDGHDGTQGPVGGDGVQGKSGKPGKTGPAGADGDIGPSGPSGSTGHPGPQGDLGLRGPKGKKGDAGRTGDRGNTGHSGESGSTGLPGPTGPKGETGSPGYRVCEDLQIQNGRAVIQRKGVGATVTFSCDNGYQLLGSKSLTCEHNGLSGYIPICFACPETVVNFGESTYKFHCGKFTWEGAKAYCESQHGSLATIETKEENDFLKYVATLIQTTEQAAPDHWWLGLTDIKTEGTFEWISGHPVTYTDWFQGTPRQPDNVDLGGGTTDVDCASLSPSASFQWFDEKCTVYTCQAFCEIWSVFVHNPIQQMTFLTSI